MHVHSQKAAPDSEQHEMQRLTPAHRGGVIARDLSSYEAPDLRRGWAGPLPPIIQETVERGGDGYWRWRDLVAQARFCDRPIRVQGKVEEVDRATGDVRIRYSTLGEPDGVILLACKNRRASRCRSCSTTYRRTTFGLVAAGLAGGLGVPASVSEHPALFVTLTAPSSGPVHSHRTKGGKLLACRPGTRLGAARTAGLGVARRAMRQAIPAWAGRCARSASTTRPRCSGTPRRRRFGTAPGRTCPGSSPGPAG